MAKFEFKLPDIGEGVVEGEIVTWLVDAGDTVTEDQELVEVMTDKATVTIQAPRAGKVTELRGKAGDVVPVGSVLAVFDVEGAGEPEAAGGAPAAAPAPQAAAAAPSPASHGVGTGTKSTGGGSGGGPVGDLRENLPGMGASKPAQSAPAPAADYFNEKPLAAPATRKLARELGVDLRRVEPSGKAGRVTPEDVERATRSLSQPPPSAPVAAPAASSQPPVPLTPPVPVPAVADEERLPINGLRKRIFENMARSKHTAAHFTFVDECDVTALKELRERTRPHAEAEGVKLTFLPFIVKAVVTALQRHPQLNCLVDDARMEMVRRRTYDVGIATATEKGLIVPVLRRADRLSIVQIAREIERIATAARDGKSQAADLGGSSFTITSLGKSGGLFATPVVNYPEVAILGVHEIKRKPVVRGDEIVIGDVMLLSLSFDHRIIDGDVGAAFAKTIIGLLEAPDRLLVSMT
jgi:pyruvate dehydrogenase E2 component (dihydrolipoamide acetyltransferase)